MESEGQGHLELQGERLLDLLALDGRGPQAHVVEPELVVLGGELRVLLRELRVLALRLLLWPRS